MHSMRLQYLRSAILARFGDIVSADELEGLIYRWTRIRTNFILHS